MNDQHVALIIEDDSGISEILQEIVASLGHASIVASTLEEVRAAIAKGGFCYVLLDMQIPAHKGARAMLGSGETALLAIRKKDPRHAEQGGHVLPVIIVTGYSRDYEFVTKMHEMGADTFIAKPFDDRIEVVLDKIRNALAKSGRVEHEACLRIPERAASAPPPASVMTARASDASTRGPANRSNGAVTDVSTAPARLVIDGTQSKRRTRVLVNDVARDLQDAHFLFLLRVVMAGLRKRVEWATHHELGIDRKPEVPSRVRSAFAELVPAGFEVVESDRDGRYRLNPRVVVERIDWATLEQHSNAMVQKMATEKRDARGDQP
jgi:DNA-binding response OmpR family regulator